MQSLRTPMAVWWLAWALVLAPAMGRMHEVLHAPSGFERLSALAELTDPQQTSAHAHAHGVAAWFDGHDALQCLVLDQLGHDHGPSQQPEAVAYSLPESRTAWYNIGAHMPAATRMFLARAPPERFIA